MTVEDYNRSTTKERASGSRPTRKTRGADRSKNLRTGESRVRKGVTNRAARLRRKWFYEWFYEWFCEWFYGLHIRRAVRWPGGYYVDDEQTEEEEEGYPANDYHYALIMLSIYSASHVYQEPWTTPVRLSAQLKLVLINYTSHYHSIDQSTRFSPTEPKFTPR